MHTLLIVDCLTSSDNMYKIAIHIKWNGDHCVTLHTCVLVKTTTLFKLKYKFEWGKDKNTVKQTGS